jgi:hypothetical protein
MSFFASTKFLITRRYDLNNAYYYLSGGYGDIVRQLTFFKNLLGKSTLIRVFVSSEFTELIYIFVPAEMLSQIIFITKDDEILALEKILRSEVGFSDTSSPDSFYGGLPISRIKALHCTYYTFLLDIVRAGKIDYEDTIKSIFRIPFDSKPFLDLKYSETLLSSFNELKIKIGLEKPVALLNVVNLSHKTLSIAGWRTIVYMLLENGYKVIINITLRAGSHTRLNLLNDSKLLINALRNEIDGLDGVFFADIPGHFLPLFVSWPKVCLGCSGGAMDVSANLGKNDVLILASDFRWIQEGDTDHNYFTDKDPVWRSTLERAHINNRQILFLGRSKGYFDEQECLDGILEYLKLNLSRHT